MRTLPQMVKNLTGKKKKEFACNTEDLDSISGWEDPLEKGMATNTRIPGTEEPGRLQSMVAQRAEHVSVANTFTFQHSSRVVSGNYKLVCKPNPVSPFLCTL